MVYTVESSNGNHVYHILDPGEYQYLGEKPGQIHSLDSEIVAFDLFTNQLVSLKKEDYEKRIELQPFLEYIKGKGRIGNALTLNILDIQRVADGLVTQQAENILYWIECKDYGLTEIMSVVSPTQLVEAWVTNQQSIINSEIRTIKRVDITELRLNLANVQENVLKPRLLKELKDWFGISIRELMAMTELIRLDENLLLQEIYPGNILVFDCLRNDGKTILDVFYKRLHAWEIANSGHVLALALSNKENDYFNAMCKVNTRYVITKHRSLAGVQHIVYRKVQEQVIKELAVLIENNEGTDELLAGHDLTELFLKLKPNKIQEQAAMDTVYQVNSNARAVVANILNRNFEHNPETVSFLLKKCKKDVAFLDTLGYQSFQQRVNLISERPTFNGLIDKAKQSFNIRQQLRRDLMNGNTRQMFSEREKMASDLYRTVTQKFKALILPNSQHGDIQEQVLKKLQNSNLVTLDKAYGWLDKYYGLAIEEIADKWFESIVQRFETIVDYKGQQFLIPMVKVCNKGWDYVYKEIEKEVVRYS